METFSPSGWDSRDCSIRRPVISPALSCLIQGHKPLLLSSVIGEDNIMMSVDLTNPDMEFPSGVSLPRGTLHLYRNKFLADGVCLDQITIHNFGHDPVETELCFDFGADFRDIFEVRGQKARAPRPLSPRRDRPRRCCCWPMKGSIRFCDALASSASVHHPSTHPAKSPCLSASVPIRI